MKRLAGKNGQGKGPVPRAHVGTFLPGAAVRSQVEPRSVPGRSCAKLQAGTHFCIVLYHYRHSAEHTDLTV